MRKPTAVIANCVVSIVFLLVAIIIITYCVKFGDFDTETTLLLLFLGTILPIVGSGLTYGCGRDCFKRYPNEVRYSRVSGFLLCKIYRLHSWKIMRNYTDIYETKHEDAVCLNCNILDLSATNAKVKDDEIKERTNISTLEDNARAKYLSSIPDAEVGEIVLDNL